MSLKIKFALFTSLLCIVVIAGITSLSYLNARLQLEKSLGERLEAIVRTGALGLDGTLHDTISVEGDAATRNKQAETETFIQMRDHLRALKKANNLSQELYTFRQVGNKLHFVVMTNDKPYIGDEYEIRQEMLPTLKDGKPARTGLYSDDHGHWLSAYAPIFDQDGNISGLLEADIRVEEFEALLGQQAFLMFIKGCGFGLVAVLLSFLLAGTVTSKINYLTDITEKISLGKMDTPIKLQGKDEVARLGASLERMRESLKIAAEMME
ncbi:MAG: HAMP domain-containing protein [Acidobacteriota bacterium]|nr:HAMP domain-containing protein [Acidobacteriota bacterium]